MRECWKRIRVLASQGVALFYSRLALPGPCRVLDDQVALLARLLNLHAEPKEVPESPWTENGLQVSNPGRCEDAPDELGTPKQGIDSVTPLAHCTAEPQKGSGTLHAQDSSLQDPKKVSTRSLTLHAGSEIAIGSILPCAGLQVSWTPAQNPETQQLADSITFAYDHRIASFFDPHEWHSPRQRVIYFSQIHFKVCLSDSCAKPLQAAWTPVQNPESQQLANATTFAYDLRIR
ncbi:hypothetical protein R1flu_008813 [Riccia fluitans]|uniref:Uncharacterized protein n=1 Tax=Riccia fluitans TaxID=41844 RepID=A0ABD1Z0B8_9MARC